MLQSRWLLQRILFFSVVLSVLLPYGTTGPVFQEGEVHWQLYSFCSQGYLQNYLGTLNARGVSHKPCSAEYRVRIQRSGAIQLIHVQTNTFICFNRRRRITVRMTGMSPKCYFYERINDQGFTELESAAEPGLFLGFNSRGRFQDPATYAFKRKPFSWIKFERYVSFRDLQSCAPRRKVHRAPEVSTPDYRAIMRAALIDKIRATHDGPYNSQNGSGPLPQTYM